MKETATVILETKIGEQLSRMSAEDQMRLFEEEMRQLAQDNEVCPTCGKRDTIVCADPWHLRHTSSSAPTPTATADLVITQLLKLHQIACGFLKTDDGTEHDFAEPNPRLDALIEILQEVPKAIIWTNYRHCIFAIEKRLKEEFGDGCVVTYFGDTDKDERREAKTQFRDMDSDVRFFLGNPQTGKFGLTLVQASTVVYYSNSYDQEERAQSEDRAHRIGQTKNVNYVDLVVPRTVDEKIINVLKNKQKLSQQITKSNWRSWIV
jgi:SNF2 family DNA or RNA helicase